MEISLEENATEYSSDKRNKVSRIIAIDAVRGFGMLLVVLGHADCPELLHRWICSFHMPLFFIISGYITTDRRDVSFQTQLKSSLKKYIKPYFLYCGIMFFIYGILRGVAKYGVSAELAKSLMRYLYGIFYSKGSLVYMPLCTPMWYLTCYFCVTILVWFADRFNTKVTVMIAVLYATIGLMLNYFAVNKLVWNVDTAFTGAVLFYFGRGLKQIDERYQIREYPLLILFMLAVGTALSFCNRIPFVNFCDNRYGLYGLMLIAAVLISFGFILLFLRSRIYNRTLVYIGRNSICFLAFNYLARLIYNIFMEKFDKVRFGVIFEFLCTVLMLIMITIFVNFITNKNYRRVKNENGSFCANKTK